MCPFIPSFRKTGVFWTENKDRIDEDRFGIYFPGFLYFSANNLWEDIGESSADTVLNNPPNLINGVNVKFLNGCKTKERDQLASAIDNHAQEIIISTALIVVFPSLLWLKK